MLKLIRDGLLCLQHREPVEGSPTVRPQLSRFWPVAAGRAPASLWFWPSSVGKFQGLGVSHLWACGQATDQNSCPHLLLTPTKPPLLVMPLGFCPGTEPPSSGFPVSHGYVHLSALGSSRPTSGWYHLWVLTPATGLVRFAFNQPVPGSLSLIPWCPWCSQRWDPGRAQTIDNL